MVTARFFNIDWNVNQNEVKFLTGLETEYKIKTDTDGNSGKQKAGGIELRPLNFSYTLNTFAGADIPKEIKKLRAIRGVVAPFYLNGKRLFAPAFMFVKFSIGNVQLTNDGQWVSCDVNLNFMEANFSLGTSSLRVIYNDVEITKKIAVTACEHTMYAEGAPDEIEIKFTDNNNLWSGWKPNNKDTIEVIDGIARSGKLFIESVKPSNGYMTLRASSVPSTMRDVAKNNNKSWEGVKFLQLATEIAGRHGLGVKSQDIDNKTYSYIKQENISDLEFLTERCDIEGYSFLVFDGNIVFYSPEKLEANTPVKVINVSSGANFEYDDDSLGAYGSCELDNGSLKGTADADNGVKKNLRKVIKCYLQSQAEANTGAKNILAKANRSLKTGKLQTDIMRDIAAASIARLKTDNSETNDGVVFYKKIVQDYVNKKTSHYFRFV